MSRAIARTGRLTASVGGARTSKQTAWKAVALNVCETTPFPILIDADRKFSKGLGPFMTEWGQNTMDRPEYDYLFKVLEVVNGMR